MTDEEIDAAVAGDPDDVLLTEAELASIASVPLEEAMVRDFGPDWRARMAAARKDAAE